jgi:hypothetical protein
MSTEAMQTITLYRAAQDDILPPDCASFAESLETARAYLDNPGFGGADLYRTDVEVVEGSVLDLTDPRNLLDVDGFDSSDLDDALQLGADVWLPMYVAAQERLRTAGYQWVLVRESFPAGTVTWIWIGSFDNEPELEVIENELLRIGP